MNIEETRRCNLWNLASLARYLTASVSDVIGLYKELLGDEWLVRELNEGLVRGRKLGFGRAIFAHGEIDTLDWFAFERVLLYVLVRLYQPERCLETGVFYGGNTAFMLAAMERNGRGTVVSIDLRDLPGDSHYRPARHAWVGDSEQYTTDLEPGFLIPQRLRSRWEFHAGDSHTIIPTLEGRFGIYVHDSDHSYEFVRRELALARSRMADDGLMVVDDIDWSNGFFAHCVENSLHPLLLTDNGKDDLRVRIGMVKLDHDDNFIASVTGRGI